MDLWNRAQPDAGAVRPLNVHEFDALVMGKIGFDHKGLIVAESDGRVVGYAHAGFGPCEPQGPSQALDTQMGSVVMLLVEPGWDDPDLERGLFREAENYLKRRGATVVYAGGQYPVNPFYWGLYGGSEFAGVLGRHAAFLRAAEDSLTGTFSLVPQIADMVNVPVIAAGGIADGRGLAAALMLGADGVVVGTRFWAAAEALVPSPLHSAALAAGGDATVRQKVLDIVRGRPWPAHEARLMVRTTISATEADGLGTVRPPSRQAAE